MSTTNHGLKLIIPSLVLVSHILSVRLQPCPSIHGNMNRKLRCKRPCVYISAYGSWDANRMVEAVLNPHGSMFLGGIVVIIHQAA